MAFGIGCSVEWTSGAAGVTKTKRGEVVAVVPAGIRPDHREIARVHGVRPLRNPGSPRDHESYLVRSGRDLYWPRTSALRPADPRREGVTPASAEALMAAWAWLRVGGHEDFADIMEQLAFALEDFAREQNAETAKKYRDAEHRIGAALERCEKAGCSCEGDCCIPDETCESLGHEPCLPHAIEAILTRSMP